MGATATLGQTAMQSAPLDHHQQARRGFETTTHWLQDEPLSHHHPDEEQEREDEFSSGMSCFVSIHLSSSPAYPHRAVGCSGTLEQVHNHSKVLHQ
ncbi:hypothetical protein ATANTOWER_016042 [Ataeniobius toweri]|uniref:Uncharacterized protein n=1 Tax=Ataeniobius toweri TaxID=208326 RepID=A0ABU7AYK8_9TELE|nr:hypothetical protein [Ataeniobius toweri]